MQKLELMLNQGHGLTIFWTTLDCPDTFSSYRCMAVSTYQFKDCLKTVFATPKEFCDSALLFGHWQYRFSHISLEE